MEVAKRIVEEGGISYALCGSLLSEVLRWKYAARQADFLDNLLFEATEIKIEAQKPGSKKTDVAFTFDGRRFRVVHVDKGLIGYNNDFTLYR